MAYLLGYIHVYSPRNYDSRPLTDSSLKLHCKILNFVFLNYT